MTMIALQHGSGRLLCSSIWSRLRVFVIVYADGLYSITHTQAHYHYICTHAGQLSYTTGVGRC